MLYLKAKIDSPLTYVDSGNYISKGSSWRYEKNNTEEFEIIICVKGTLFIQQNEERYKVAPGNSLLLLPGRIHSGYALSEQDISFYWIKFRKESNFEIIDDQKAFNEILISSDKTIFSEISDYILIPLFFRPINVERPYILINQLLHIANSDCYSKQAPNLMLTSILAELTSQLVSNIRGVKEYKGSARQIAVISAWIKNHIEQPISVEAIAKAFKYNKNYLSRAFRQKTGMHLQEYINRLKIEKAKVLLYHSEKSIKEIAFSVGYRDEKYFMKLFRRYENTTTKEFQNAYFQTSINDKN